MTYKYEIKVEDIFLDMEGNWDDYSYYVSFKSLRRIRTFAKRNNLKLKSIKKVNT